MSTEIITISGRIDGPEIQLRNPTKETLDVCLRAKLFGEGTTNKSSSGMVYAVTDGRAVKIGKSGPDFEKRIKQLQTAHSVTLSLLAVGQYDFALTAEKTFHLCYTQFKRKGEWFLFPDKILEQVVRYISKGQLPDENEEMRWAGLIEECGRCGDRCYQGGWCFGCGMRIPHRINTTEQEI
jgi:hypothetical protein